ncbi:unnamed protein product [Owenia fusiformis]|uniref:Uncharacterized protein n=1 Tax=Owenia fusiformis TaxID=6347 RepID=A0A8J1U282_OWEFU|nr:unnamed protein product [Owenia fusiformis]
MDTEDQVQHVTKSNGENPGEKDPLINEDGRQTVEITLPKRAIIIEPVMCLYFVAWAPVWSIAQQYVYSRVAEEHQFPLDSRNDTNIDCNINKSNPLYATEQTVQQITSHWLLLNQIALMVPAMVTTVMFGAYSDSAGRRFVILSPLIGCTLRAGMFLVVIAFKLNIAFLLIGSILEGLSGSLGAAIMACFSYACDVSTNENRSFKITIMEISIGIGIASSLVSIGHFIKHAGYMYPYVFVIGVQTLNIIYVYFFVPETVRRQQDAKFLSLRHFRDTFVLYTKDNGTNRRWKLCLLIIIFLLCEMVIAGRGDTQNLKLMKTPLCFNSILLGYFGALQAFTMQLGSMVAVKLFQHWVSDEWFAVFGTFGGMANNIFFGFANTTLLMFMVPIVGLAGNMVLPFVRAMQSKLVQPLEQGALFAGQASIQSLCVLLATALFNSTYAATLGIWDKTVFMMMGGNNFLALILIVLYMILQMRERTVKQSSAHSSSYEAIN